MKHLRGTEINYGAVDPSHFTGEASVGRVLVGDGDQELRIYRVRFQPRSRTHWHTHTGAQLLCIEEGEGKVQKVGSAPFEVKAGDMVHIAAGEKHWHGAGPETPMTHLAINLGDATEWLEPVSDDEYAG